MQKDYNFYIPSRIRATFENSHLNKFTVDFSVTIVELFKNNLVAKVVSLKNSCKNKAEKLNVTGLEEMGGK